MLIFSLRSSKLLTFDTPILLPPLFGFTIQGILISFEIFFESIVSFLVINICLDEGIFMSFTKSIYFFLLKVNSDT